MARHGGVPSHLIDGPADIDPAWFSGGETVLITAGASAPEDVVQQCIGLLRERFRRRRSSRARCCSRRSRVFSLPDRPLREAARNAREPESGHEDQRPGIPSRRGRLHGLSQPVRSLLVRLTTDSGLEGWGEAGVGVAARANCRPGATRSCRCWPDGASSTSRNCTRWRRSPPRRCAAAVEMACWDLIGRTVGQPVCRLLGGEYRRRIPLAVRLAGRRPERLARLAREMAAQGFHCQVVSSSGEPRLDRRMLPAVRESVGDRDGTSPGRPGRTTTSRPPATCAAKSNTTICNSCSDPLRGAGALPAGRAWAGRPACRWPSGGRSAARPTCWPWSAAARRRCVVLDMEQVGGLAPARACAAVAAAARHLRAVGRAAHAGHRHRRHAAPGRRHARPVRLQ